MKFFSLLFFVALVLVCTALDAGTSRVTLGPPSANHSNTTLTFYYDKIHTPKEHLIRAIHRAHPNISIHTVPCEQYKAECASLAHPELNPVHLILEDSRGRAEFKGMVCNEHEVLNWLRMDIASPFHVKLNPSIWSDVVSHHPGNPVLLRLYAQDVTRPDNSFAKLAAKLRSTGILSVWGTWETAGDLIHAHSPCVTAPGLWLISHENGESCARFTSKPSESVDDASVSSTFPFEDTYKWVLQHLWHPGKVETPEGAERFLQTDHTGRRTVVFGGLPAPLGQRLAYGVHSKTGAQVVLAGDGARDLIWKEMCADDDAQKWILVLDPFSEAKYCVREGDAFVPESRVPRKDDEELRGEKEFTPFRLFVQTTRILEGKQAKLATKMEKSSINGEEKEPIISVGGHADYDTPIEEIHGKDQSDEEDAPFWLGGFIDGSIHISQEIGEKIIGWLKKQTLIVSDTVRNVTSKSDLDRPTTILIGLCVIGIIVALTTTLCIPRVSPVPAVKRD